MRISSISIVMLILLLLLLLCVYILVQVYKTSAVADRGRASTAGAAVDSARANLASTFVNAFVNGKQTVL